MCSQMFQFNKRWITLVAGERSLYVICYSILPFFVNTSSMLSQTTQTTKRFIAIIAYNLSCWIELMDIKMLSMKKVWKKYDKSQIETEICKFCEHAKKFSESKRAISRFFHFFKKNSIFRFYFEHLPIVFWPISERYVFLLLFCAHCPVVGH